MARSSATTVDQYLEELAPEQREVMAKVRAVVKKNMPKGYEESMCYGMISWSIPLKRYPKTYNGQPLGYVSLAAQKNYFALYLTGVYIDPAQEKQLRDSFAKAGKKLDIGKSCLRFRKIDDLPLDAIGRIVASTTPDDYIAKYEAVKKK